MTNLQLFRLATDYPRGYSPRGFQANVLDSPEDSDARVFFGVQPSEGAGDGYTLLILPDDDPRSSGMWDAAGNAATPTDGKTYRGWNVESRYVTPVETPTPDPYAALVPGAWFTWGTRVVWYRVDHVDGDNVHTDRRLYSETPTTADAGQESPDVWSKGSMRDRLHVLPPFGQETPQEATPTAPQETPEEAYLRGRRDAEEAARREMEAWKARATEIAHTYANDNGLCSEFDRCMVDVGLTPRTREYEVHVCYTFTVEASNADAAAEEAEEYLGGMDADDLIRYHAEINAA